jgi:hypothetical protein
MKTLCGIVLIAVTMSSQICLAASGTTGKKANAVIPEIFRGHWDVNKEECKHDTESMVIIEAKSVGGLEWGGGLKSIKIATDQSVTAIVAGEDELGQKFRETYTFKLLPDGRLEFGDNKLIRCK